VSHEQEAAAARKTTHHREEAFGACATIGCPCWPTLVRPALGPAVVVRTRHASRIDDGVQRGRTSLETSTPSITNGRGLLPPGGIGRT
jgi:hypothetical protein